MLICAASLARFKPHSLLVYATIPSVRVQKVNGRIICLPAWLVKTNSEEDGNRQDEASSTCSAVHICSIDTQRLGSTVPLRCCLGMSSAPVHIKNDISSTQRACSASFVQFCNRGPRIVCTYVHLLERRRACMCLVRSLTGKAAVE